MNKFTRICVVCPAETALKKLSAAHIPVRDCVKNGARFIFSVKDKHVKKVFAIFKKPCYNIAVTELSRKARLKRAFFRRFAIALGAALFLAAAIYANSLVLKISVTGSGSYLAPEVMRIIKQSGARLYRPASGIDVPSATGRILALPQVTFCNVQKRGSILYVDVQVDEENLSSSSSGDLVADVGGKVLKITAICGIARVAAGQEVQKGDVLIAAKTLAGDRETAGVAVGFAVMQCARVYEYPAPCESEGNLANAYKAALIFGEEVISRSHSVKSAQNGVIYIVEITYLHKLNININ